MKTHKTRNDLPSNTKSTVIGLLNEALASMIDLALLTKQAHWNLKGPQFIAVHELLDSFRKLIDNHTTLSQNAPSSLAAPHSAAFRRYRPPPSSRPTRPISTRSTTTWMS